MENVSGGLSVSTGLPSTSVNIIMAIFSLA